MLANHEKSNQHLKMRDASLVVSPIMSKTGRGFLGGVSATATIFLTLPHMHKRASMMTARPRHRGQGRPLQPIQRPGVGLRRSWQSHRGLLENPSKNETAPTIV